jgi:sodium transport system permease protein
MRGTLLVCKKEFLELSKDRRTLFFTFLLPILLYPALFLMIAGLGQRDSAQRLGKPSRVFVADPAQVLEPRLRQATMHFELAAKPEQDLKLALREHRLDLCIDVEASASEKLAAQEPFQLHVLVDETDPASTLALSRLQDLMRSVDKAWVAGRLKALHASPQLTQPSQITTENIADASLETGKLLGSFLPYVLMLMMFQGALQHGIYVTAGEKERGTLQSLLATPLPRSRIIWGKLIYIFCMGLIATVLNLLSLGISLSLVMGKLAGAATAQGTSGSLAAMAHPGVLLLCFVLLVPLALLFASFILFMGIRARNTAEAGTSLMPGLFLIVTLGAFSLAPGIERITYLPYVPILNVSLTIRKLFSQQGDIPEFLIAFLMTAGLSLLMTWAAARLLDRESAIFGRG